MPQKTFQLPLIHYFYNLWWFWMNVGDYNVDDGKWIVVPLDAATLLRVSLVVCQKFI